MCPRLTDHYKRVPIQYKIGPKKRRIPLKILYIRNFTELLKDLE